MSQATLLVTAGAAFAAASAFLFLARMIGGRPYGPRTAGVGYAFATWWYAIAFVAAADAIRILQVAVAPPDIALFVTLALMKVIATGVSIWALGYYVTYMWTGTGRFAIPLAIVAAIHSGMFLHLILVREPNGVVVGPWGASMTFAASASLPEWAGILVLLMFFVPALVLTVAYLLLIPVVKTADRRMRVASVGTAVLLWNLASILQQWGTGGAQAPAVPGLMMLGVPTALLVYVTYFPPDALRRRFGMKQPAA